MKTIKVTIEAELTPEQLLSLVAAQDVSLQERKRHTPWSGQLTLNKEAFLGATKIAHSGPAPTKGRLPKLPKIDTAPFLRAPNDRTGNSGRPTKLNVDGMRKVWELSKLGYTPMEISEAFGVVSNDYVRQLVKRIRG